MMSVLAAKNRKLCRFVVVVLLLLLGLYLDMGNNSGLALLGLWITAASSCDKDTTNSVCVLRQQLDPISTWQDPL